MSIYANTGQTFYWLKSSGVKGPKDFAGRKIGNPPGDASRVMWPAFAKAVGLAPDSVSFVNIGPTAKSAALKSHAVDIISDFYNSHDIKLREFGSDLGSLNWKEIGLNSYGNSIIVNGAFLEKNPKLARGFRTHHAKGLCRLRRRFRALPEGVAGAGHAASTARSS